MMAFLFYTFIVIVIVGPAIFMWTFWRDARGRQWNYTTDISRAMYVDVAKTLITASGIAVALVSSASARVSDDVARFSARVGVASLIICISAALCTLASMLSDGRNLDHAHRCSSRGTGIQKFEFTAETPSEVAALKAFECVLRKASDVVLYQEDLKVLNFTFPITPEELAAWEKASKK
jgi:hypothetical protein